MLLPSRNAARGVLVRMIFILVTVTNRGEGSYHRDNPSEQVNYKALYHKGYSEGTHDRTSQTIVQHRQQNSLPNNATVDHLVDNGDPEENGEVYVGYGRDPWGPSTLMGNEAGGSRGRGMTSQRPRRNVVHLYNMVSCATGCNPIIYKGYGCYCGFLGSGAPIDGIDRCCKMHDWCYNTANCPMFFEYLVPYYWKCYRHRPLCAIDHGIYGGPGSCAQRLCECDRLLSECLSHYRCPKRRAVCHSSPVRFLIQSLIMF